ncbi:hypothetical protein CCAX7_001950 [Capsulimonas corticalis]|uniref:Uncharacterized protein n=1 Tax=Capsulimonas corticalis TaxID=2219043 RepID=A0A402CRV6_9BACT|nr:hypothetical protein [Capsulimonas corticalis]BDI28144.1 hypothetical protein CCAX7_001950 [Capsulimonas corticalis]
MKGHEFQSGLRLQDWIEHELSHLAAKEQEDAVSVNIADRNLSLRTPVVIHVQLARIAEKLGRSKSGVSEEILQHAVRDVYQQFGLPPVTREDVEEFAAGAEKPAAEKP